MQAFLELSSCGADVVGAYQAHEFQVTIDEVFSGNSIIAPVLGGKGHAQFGHQAVVNLREARRPQQPDDCAVHFQIGLILFVRLTANGRRESVG